MGKAEKMGTRWKSVVCTRGLVAAVRLGQMCGEGEGAAATASWVWTKYTCSPHTCCQPSHRGPVASIVNQQSEAVRECLAPTLQSCLDPYYPWVTEVLEEAQGLGGSRSLLLKAVGCWGLLLISCTGSRYIRNFVSALTAV